MDWIVAIGDSWLTTLAWLAGLALAFGVLARLMPCNRGMYWWKDLYAAGTDFLYWFILPLLVRLGRTLMLIAAVGLLFGDADSVGFAAVTKLPLWLQCPAILLIQDILLYAAHRLFHTRPGWRFHAIHHSPKVLDWTATSRFHLVNNLLSFSLADIAVLLLGFSPVALVTLAPFNLIYSAMVHANLNWTFGPLRRVFASPVFHRWHHTLQEEGLDKNFASTFPLLDVIFGTFYMPPGKLPERFGTGDPDFPEDFWGQFIHPFRRASAQPRPARRPIALVMVSVLAVVGVLCGRTYLKAHLPDANEQLTAEAEQTRLRQMAAETDGHALHTGHTGPILGVAISADGQRIVTGGEDGTVRLWDGATGQEQLALIGHTRPVRGVAISADGQRIVSASYDRTAKVWDGQTGQELRTLTGHRGGVLSVALSADGQRIVTGSADFTARVWDAATGQEKLTLTGPPGAVLGVAVSGWHGHSCPCEPAGQECPAHRDGRIVSAHGTTVKVWDGRTGRETLTFKGHTEAVWSVAISADGGRIVSGDDGGTVTVWDAATGREKCSLKGHTGPVYSVAISPDGGRLVSGGADGMVKVWDAATGGQKCAFTGHTDAILSVALSADGQRIVSGSRDETMKLWDVPKGEPVAFYLSRDRQGAGRKDSNQPLPDDRGSAHP